jgi:hypothetical protein
MNRAERKRQQVEWMKAHKELWIDLDPDGALYLNQRERWRLIANGLKDAGLISRTTGLIDVPVSKLIQAARIC